MEYEGLIVVQIGNAKRKPAFQAILEFMTVAGFEVHEKEIALRAEDVVDVIPIVRIVERIAGVTT
jgi:hypothetical protein